MKKHNIIALIGVLALTANLLIPGLAFGQAEQTGTLDLMCDPANPSFAVAPVASFAFTSDGAGATVNSSSVTQYAYKDAVAITDLIEFLDVRDPSALDCNTGLTLDVAAESTDADDCYFEMSPGTPNATCGPTIPLDGVYAVTSNGHDGNSGNFCPSGYFQSISSSLCFEPDALCGNRYNINPCDNTYGTTPLTIATLDADLADITTWGGFESPLGTAPNTPESSINLVLFNGSAISDSLYGQAAIGVTYAVEIPPTAQSGSYTLELLYTLSPGL